MRQSNLPRSILRANLLGLILASTVLLLCMSQGAFAQSGRRGTKQTVPSPPVAPETKPEPAVVPTAVDTPPIATLIVNGDRTSSAFDIPTGYLDFAINACVDRLGKARALSVSSGGTNVSKKEAIDAAKKQTIAHVVWMELKVENDSTGAGGITVQYFIFNPETGKVKNFGRVYADRANVSRGPVGIGLPRSTSQRAPLNYLLKQAGEEVAERVIGVFQVSVKD